MNPRLIKLTCAELLKRINRIDQRMLSMPPTRANADEYYELLIDWLATYDEMVRRGCLFKL